MRTTTLLRQLIGVTQLFVREANFEEGGLVVDVVPSWRRSRCGDCGRKASRYDRMPARRWGHLSYRKARIWLQYSPWRTSCADCGVKVEQVPWAERASRFTRQAEELIAYLAQITDKTTVQKLTGIAWRTVGDVVERVIQRTLSSGRLDNLRQIGIDEFSYRKRHRYLTIVVNHETRRVVWVGHGKSGQTLRDFFDQLEEERCQQIEMVTMDMAAGYIAAVTEQLPHATIVFDRFHVQQLASNALDEVRRALVRETEDPEAARAIKNARWPLLMNPWNVTRSGRIKLREVEQHHKPLFRGHLLKELLARALDYRQTKRARETLDEWCAWASRSRLKPFVRLARTIRKWKEEILAYISTRLTNGLVEGLNNKVRVISRRAYGFHSPGPLISMIFLCCGGIVLKPPLP